MNLKLTFCLMIFLWSCCLVKNRHVVHRGHLNWASNDHHLKRRLTNTETIFSINSCFPKEILLYTYFIDNFCKTIQDYRLSVEHQADLDLKYRLNKIIVMRVLQKNLTSLRLVWPVFAYFQSFRLTTSGVKIFMEGAIGFVIDIVCLRQVF